MNGSSSMRLIAMLIAALVGAFAVHAGPGQVQLPVPRATIYPGQVIDRAMLVERAFRINGTDQPAGAASAEALVGKVARQTLLPGRPINADAVREPHAVTQGQAAVIIFQSGALTITGTAVALQSGGTGDVVSVRNADSGRIIKGIIGADGAVHVGDP
jgi:flagella basal body P-ring formation protein FlgA